MTTAETITTAQIRTLQTEAAEHGDTEMVATCELALYGATVDLRYSATVEVVAAINAAAAMAESE